MLQKNMKKFVRNFITFIVVLLVFMFAPFNFYVAFIYTICFFYFLMMSMLYIGYTRKENETVVYLIATIEGRIELNGEKYKVYNKKGTCTYSVPKSQCEIKKGVEKEKIEVYELVYEPQSFIEKIVYHDECQKRYRVYLS